MGEWCLTPACRRRGLLSHFEGKVQAGKTQCNRTCDYCKTPREVEEAIKARKGACRLNHGSLSLAAQLRAAKCGSNA